MPNRDRRRSKRLVAADGTAILASVGMRPASPRVEDAIALAARLHSGQRYPSPEAEPYIFHPLRVMLSFVEPAEQMAAVLHDAIEDTELELDDLVAAGYPAEVVGAIECLTQVTLSESLAMRRRWRGLPPSHEAAS